MNICTPPSAAHDTFGARRRAVADELPPPKSPYFGRTLVRLWDARRKAASQRLSHAEQHAYRAFDELHHAETVLARLRASAAALEREGIGGDTYREICGRGVLDACNARAQIGAAIALKVRDVRARAQACEQAQANLAKARQQHRSVGRRHQKLERWLQRLEAVDRS